jgi:hypothetical protein
VVIIKSAATRENLIIINANVVIIYIAMGDSYSNQFSDQYQRHLPLGSQCTVHLTWKSRQCTHCMHQSLVWGSALYQLLLLMLMRHPPTGHNHRK